MGLTLSSGASVKEQIALLVDLQEVDNKADQLREQKVQLPLGPEAIRRSIQTARKALEEAAAAYKHTQTSYKSLEIDLETQEGLIQRSKGRMAELKTNKEYQAHLFEIELATKRRGEIEEQLLLLMDQADAAKQWVAQANQDVTKCETELADALVKMESAELSIDQELASLDRARSALASRLDPVLLKQYDQLKALHTDRAMVPIRNGTCMGCQLHVPPQRVAEVKRAEALHACSHCHRFLYWPSASGEPTETKTERNGRR